MVARKRKRKRTRTARDVMKQRLGVTGWKGSRPFSAWSKMLTTVTLGEGHNPGTTTGTQFGLPVNNWNDPLGNLGTMVAGTGSKTESRHPMNHDRAIAEGYERVQVQGWQAEIIVNWIRDPSATQDFVIAYTFSEDINTAVALTAGDTGRLENMSFQTNPRWTLKKFNATGGSDEIPKRKSVTIRVPDVFAYCKLIAEGSLGLEANNISTSHTIADVNFNSISFPQVPLFCRVAIYTESGLAMLVDSIHVQVKITQRVKIMRDNLGAEDMAGGNPDVHA